MVCPRSDPCRYLNQRIAFRGKGERFTEAHFHHQETPYSNISRYGRWNNGWISLIEAYSKRKLTRPEDKLPALAGLSRMLAQVTRDTYFARV
jgi:hypothetical protein